MTTFVSTLQVPSLTVSSPGQSSQWFSPLNKCSHQGTLQYIKTHLFVCWGCFFSCRIFIWKNLDKQTFFYIIAVAVGLCLKAIHLCYSIQASHPSDSTSKGLPFLWCYVSIFFSILSSLWNAYWLDQSSWPHHLFMLSHHSMVLVKYHFLTVSTSMHVRLYHHCLPIMLCHHLCIPMPCVFVLCSEERVSRANSITGDPLDESPEVSMCVRWSLVQKRHHFDLPVFGCNLKCTIVNQSHHTRHLNIVVWNICMLKKSDGNNVFSFV